MLLLLFVIVELVVLLVALFVMLAPEVLGADEASGWVCDGTPIATASHPLFKNAFQPSPPFLALSSLLDCPSRTRALCAASPRTTRALRFSSFSPTVRV